jgi:DNA-binding transcriptional MerR regulator
MGQRRTELKRRRHTPEQVVRKLREADRLLASGIAIPEVAKALEVSEPTYHRWRAQFGRMKADDVKRLKELERENLVSPSRRRQAVLMLRDRLGVSERRACLSGCGARRACACRSGRDRLVAVRGCAPEFLRCDNARS